MADAKQVKIGNSAVSFKDNYAREQIKKINDGLFAGAYYNNNFYNIISGTTMEKSDSHVYLDLNTFEVYGYNPSTKKYYVVFKFLHFFNETISTFNEFVSYAIDEYMTGRRISFYAGDTTEYMTHGYIYQVVKTTMVPTGTENPHALAWVEESGGSLRFTSDTTVKSGKTYYTIRFVQLKVQDDAFTPELQAKLESICNGYFIGKFVNGDLVDIERDIALPKKINFYYLDILTKNLYKYTGGSFIRVNGGIVDIFDLIDAADKLTRLAIDTYESNGSIRYMGTTTSYLTHGHFYEVSFKPYMITETITINPAEKELYELDNSTSMYNKTTDTEVVSGKVYFEATLEQINTQGVTDVTSVENRVTSIEGKIPSNASSSNKLVTVDDIYNKNDVVVKSNVAGLLKNDGTVEEDYLKSTDIGTAAAKDFTTNVSPGNHSLVESNAVYSAISNAITTVFKPRGNITVAELTSALLTSDHKDELYSVTDSGVTTADFIGGAGKTINEGDTVTIVAVGPSTYKFNLSPGMFHLDHYQEKTLDTPISIGNTSNLSNIETILATLASIIPSTASSSTKLLTSAVLIPYVQYTHNLSGSTITQTDRQNAITTLLNNYHLVDDKGMGCASVAYGNNGVHTYIMMRETGADVYPAYVTVLELQGSASNLCMVRAAKNSGGNWYILNNFAQYLRTNQVQGSAIEGSTLPVASGALYKQGTHSGSLAKNDCLDVELKGTYTCYLVTIQVLMEGGKTYLIVHNESNTFIKNLWTGDTYTSTRYNAVTVANGITITNMANNKDRIRNENNENELIWTTGPISRVEFVESQDISG